MRTRKKINVAILFGGKSAEHEVSLRSAKNVYEAINKDKYNPILIGIDPTGKWRLAEDARVLIEGTSSRGIGTLGSREVTFAPEGYGEILPLAAGTVGSIDVAFPILHGPMGEDGTVQGLLKLAQIPFVGASVLGSAVGMDKDVMKRLLRDAGIPVAKFLALEADDPIPEFSEVQERLGLPVFVKPANMGSSVGVSKVLTAGEYREAVALAFSFDVKILVEEFVLGRELECAVLGNRQPAVSVVGEIRPSHEFYSYEAKYLDENGAVLEIPAKISEAETQRVQELALRSFRVLACEGMGRVDLFLRPDGQILVNEINTIPGFTKISMYPKLWECSGVSYSELIDRLIGLAMERFEKEKRLKTRY